MATASRTITAAKISQGHRNRNLARFPILPPVTRPKATPTTMAKSHSTDYLLGGESRRGSRKDLHADRQRGLVDAESRRVMRRRRFTFGLCAEHEIAAGNACQKLGKIVAHRQWPAEDTRPVADELVSDVEHRARHVGFVHQRHGAVDEI